MISETKRQTDERFARIEADITTILRVLNEHSSILREHSRILEEHGRLIQALTDAVRDKMGFRPQS